VRAQAHVCARERERGREGEGGTKKKGERDCVCAHVHVHMCGGAWGREREKTSLMTRFEVCMRVYM